MKHLLPLILWFFLGGTAYPQAATAIVQGPDKADAGDLVILDASQSKGTAFRWVLAYPKDRTFLQFNDGKTVVFASGKPAEYLFVLVVAGIDKDTLVVSTAEKRVVVGNPTPGPGPSPSPNPGPSPNPNPVPTPNPSDKATAAIYVYEKSQSAVPPQVAAAISRLNVDRYDAGFLGAVVEQDVITGTGTVPKAYATAIQRAKQEGLPALVILSGETVLRVVKNPQTETQVMESVK